LLSDKRIRWLDDILENVARIERFTAGADFRRFVGDEQITFAVLHALLVISEAARRLGADAEMLAPDQPWRAIRALGNVLRHEYGGVDPIAIWRIVTDDLPVLKAAVDRALSSLRLGDRG
jgi:uncharacterized protein with HEPN domain